MWKKYMTKLGQYYNQYCDEIAKSEGWALFNADGILQIQAIDEPEEGDMKLSSDGEAYDLCVRKARDGSLLHLLAIFLDGKIATDDIDVPRILVENTTQTTQPI